MRLYQQLVLFMLAATVLPLVVVGFWLLRTSERELAAQIGNEQRALASLAAERSSEQVSAVIDSVTRAADLIDWEAATLEEARGGLSLLYQQSELVSAVALVDSTGKDIVDPVYVESPQDKHPSFSTEMLPQLHSAIPFAALSKGARGETVLSAPYARDGSVAFAFSIKAGPDENSPFLVVELSLRAIDTDLSQRAAGRFRIDLVTRDGTAVASTEPLTLPMAAEPLLWEQWTSQAASTGRLQTVLALNGVRELVAGATGQGRVQLVAIVRIAEATALQPVRAMRRTVLFSIAGALGVLLALGGLFTRRLNSRLGTVVRGVEALGKGDLSTRVPISGSDELTELATTFNSMGGELEKARAKLLTWNEELKTKVEEATADLRAAQAQLVEAQKLAAVGQLGAGVAHEINNPLAGILGNAQLLMLDMNDKHPDFETLRKIELSAKRCKEITQNLLRFSQQKEKTEPRPVDLNIILRDALKASAQQSVEEGVTIETELSPQPVRVKGDPGQLVQVVVAMIANGRTAMLKAPTKKLTVRTRAEGADGVIEIIDGGKGIKPEHLPRIFEPFFTTKDIWTNVGLGLSVAYRVVTEHKGRIDVKTEVGQGSTFKIQLPLHDASQKVDPAPAVPEASKPGGPLSWTSR